MFSKFIQLKLEKSVKKYFKNHPEVKLVVVTGSVGKTSTKIAIGTVLNEKMRVRLHEWDYNSKLSVPLTILGIKPPESGGFGQWMSVFKAVKQRVKQPADVDVIVQEIGTNSPGQMAHYGKYMKPDIAVVTALSPVHMDSFKTLDALAAEQLGVVNYSKSALINRDDIPGEHAVNIANPNINTYGTTEAAEYSFITEDYSQENGFSGMFMAAGFVEPVLAQINLTGEHSVRAAVAAAAVATRLGFSPAEAAQALQKLSPIYGCMNMLKGIKDSTIIDDSYSSGPLSASAALRTLYQLSAPQKIVVFGDMAGLGDMAASAYESLGALCDPAHLTHVITVGDDTEAYLGPAAKARGNHVTSYKNALNAGAAVNKYLEDGGVVLFKGSKGSFLEEAIKVILLSVDDESKLVRQSADWQITKQDYFSKIQ